MAEYRYAAWVQWMNEVYYKPQPVPGYPNFKADRAGNVYKNDELIKPFKSNGYQQVCLNGTRKNKVVKGVHQVIAMTFDERYYDGCHVHHKDENKQNNNISNLDVEDPRDHARHHANPENLKKYIRDHGPTNKGKKMSPEFCEKCRQSALKRAAREKAESSSHKYFRQNQFIDKDGNKKSVDPIWYNKFREACRKGALKRHSK